MNFSFEKTKGYVSHETLTEKGKVGLHEIEWDDTAGTQGSYPYVVTAGGMKQSFTTKSKATSFFKFLTTAKDSRLQDVISKAISGNVDKWKDLYVLWSAPEHREKWLTEMSKSAYSYDRTAQGLVPG